MRKYKITVTNGSGWRKEYESTSRNAKKHLRDNYGARVYYVGYCDAEALLRGHDRIGANGGVYGWNWSAYRPAHDIIINTGYRNMTGTDARKVTSNYEKQAREVFHDWNATTAEKEKHLEQIRAAWFDALRAM